jgi:hypothetical protein
MPAEMGTALSHWPYLWYQQLPTRVHWTVDAVANGLQQLWQRTLLHITLHVTSCDLPSLCVCLQITDDSEMAMCLLQGLMGSDASGPLPLDAIASCYINWLHSPPFDIGGHHEVAYK